MRDMNRKIGAGVMWNLIGLFFSRGSSMVFTVFLAGILAPEAFGLIAMMMVFFELAAVFVESGMGQALIRSKHIESNDLSTVFYTNLGLGLLAYIMLYVSAPLVATFYSQPELEFLVVVTGLVVIVNAFKVVPTAVLSRKMNFREQTKASALSAVGSGFLAVTAAYLGAGVWSLVVQMLSSSVISTLVLWGGSKWRPVLSFDYESLKRLFGFGSHLLAEGMLTVLFNNSYVLVIGKLFSAEVTGLYFFAKRISQLIAEQLTGTVQQATLPALATMQDDNETLKIKYRQILHILMFVSSPIILSLAAIAEPLFVLAFKQEWSGSILYFQILSFVGVLFPLHAMNINILNVKGRSDLVFKIGVVKKIIGILLLVASIPFGVTGIVFGQVVSSVLALIPNTYYSKKLIGYGLKEQLLDSLGPVLLAATSAVLSWWAISLAAFHPAIAAVFGLIIFSVLYIFGSWFLRVNAFIFVLKKISRRLSASVN